MDLIRRIFDGSLMPHGHCLLWREDLLFLHVGGDILTTVSYFAIPSALIHLVRKRNDLVFNWIFLLFAGFILFCGITHFISLINVWHGYYFIEGVAKFITGIISTVTAVMIWRLIPSALAIPSNADLLIKNQALHNMEEKLLETNRLLEQRVQERTQQLEQMAVTDSLTGIANRGEIIKRLNTELERARRYQKPLCLLMLDLDHFKSINDTYGHQAGDTVLIDAAKTLQSLCRTSDSVGRYGGEEFLVVLPETDTSAARMLAERIRKTMAQRQLYNLDNKEITYTCSVGVAEFTDNTESASLLHSADQALYKAKFDGRNRIVTAEEIVRPDH